MVRWCLTHIVCVCVCAKMLIVSLSHSLSFHIPSHILSLPISIGLHPLPSVPFFFSNVNVCVQVCLYLFDRFIPSNVYSFFSPYSFSQLSSQLFLRFGSMSIFHLSTAIWLAIWRTPTEFDAASDQMLLSVWCVYIFGIRCVFVCDIPWKNVHPFIPFLNQKQ